MTAFTLTRRAALAGLAAGLVLPAAPALALDGLELLRKIDASLQPTSYESYRKLINIEPSGRRKEYVMYSLKKGRDRVAILFLEPASDKGRVTLRQGDNMWLFIPSVGKPVRITSLQSVTGGVFNNADIMQLEFEEEYAVAKLEEKGDEYVLSLKARNASVAYDKLVMAARRSDQTLLRIEAYASSGMLLKTLHYKEPKDLGDGVLRPSVIETDSPLQKGYKSVIIFGKVTRRDIPDEVFTLNALSRIEEMRK